ncbi:hypothetical protein CD30_06925 [Ureibacillus massiliensis 4400831 = CIP 108448 = CCUG 49529]|uniref:Transporter n=1 Tax=Ureibacillus massiliensis 4400831 = CIP 108448 = CCUG 49529 TaxID=1211035 RepID=A0A0A3JVX5_9BACL|nr:ABC-2 transporter permease [Ureibacillus massiliensis]KGR91172.1 hypothetical protein CD30_06925 [Ureibacillus massiliensis 4400831 = CIP 108448 = CCUG 49529]
MRALLIKDLLILSKQFKLMSLIFIFFIVVSFMTEMGMVMIVMALIYSALQVSTTFSFEEMSHWNKFVNTLPIERKTIVQSKFILGILLTIVTLIILSPIVYFSSELIHLLSFKDLFSGFILILSTSLIYLSVTIPIYIKFGMQTGKFVIFAIVFIPVFSTGFVQYFIREIGLNQLMQYLNLLPIASLVVLVISYFVSVRWYEKKQY